MSWWRRRRLRARIFLPFSLLLLGTVLATLWLVSSAVSRQVSSSLRRQLAVTANVFLGRVGERAERLANDTSLIAADFALKRALATYDPETLATVAVNYRERIGLDLLWITDEAGVLLADSGSQLPPGRDLAWVLPSSQADSDVAVVTEVDGALVQLAAVPVLGPDPIGYLVAGLAIDDRTAAQLERETGSEVTFGTTGRVYASSWPAPALASFLPGEGLGDLPVRHERRDAFVVRVDDERFLSALVPVKAALGMPLFALVQQSYDAALQPFYALRRRVVAIGGAAIAAALLLAALMAAGLAAPLQGLVAAMGDVLGGNLRRRVQSRREDEIGFLASSFNQMVAGLEERERIKDTFGRFVSRDVAAAVLADGAELAGERCNVSILFQDIRGFTSLTEHTEASVLVSVMNRFFTRMVAAVEGEGGVIRQFTGDGVMGLFGAPVHHDDDPARAVRAARSMVACLPAFNRELVAEGLPALRIGIGIATGDVVAGRMGPDERVEYSVVGDAVNLASRIEGLTKEVGAVILVSSETAARLGPEISLGRRVVMPVRGKEKPVEVVEVL